jgi:hypothetical protein
MNERIKQITGQVLDELVPNTWTTLGYDKIKEIQFRTAELVVQDSIKQILEWKNEPFPFDEHTAVWILKKHFGVEE